MKLVTYIILLISITTQAQFAEPHKRWALAEEYPENTFRAIRTITTRTMVYGVLGTEVFEGNTYYKIYETPDTLFRTGHVHVGSVRQEGDSVFALTGEEELLIYDWSLQAGDTVMYHLSLFEDLPIVVSTTYTTTVGGESKRVIEFEPYQRFSQYLNEVWIEDVGSIHGPLYPVSAQLNDTDYYRQFRQYLTCASLPDGMWWSESRETIWQNPEASHCHIYEITGITEYDDDVGVYYDRVAHTIDVYVPGDVDTVHVAVWKYEDYANVTTLSTTMTVHPNHEGAVWIEFEEEEYTTDHVIRGDPQLVSVMDNTTIGLDCRPLPVFWLPDLSTTADYTPTIPDFSWIAVPPGPGKLYTIDTSSFTPGHYRLEGYFDCRYFNTFILIHP